MGILSRLKRKCEKEGIIEVLQFGMRKAIGVQPWKEEIDTCFYFLNKYVDARTLPPTDDPDLRILQLCDVELLKIFDKACRRLGLEYWLDWGTLLGAVRHKGFIPWDDDMDVAMPRKDFCRADTELKAFMETFGIDVTRNGVMLGIGYKHAQTGIWLDVFPADVICSEQTLEEARGNLDKANKGLYTYFRRNREVVFEKSIFGIRKYFNKFGGGQSLVCQFGNRL